jgi:hypothetical protein
LKYVRDKITSRFLLYLIIAIFLIQLPIAGDYVSVLDTVVHESGHAVVALFSGHIEKIALLSDSEGITFGDETNKFEEIISSMAGYICSSLMGFLSFWLISKKKYTLFIDILLAIIFINLIFWVRNPFGIIWLVTFAFGFLLLLINGKQQIVNQFLLLLASIILVDSIKSSIEILVMSFIHPGFAGDAANLAALTMIIPTKVWGIFFLAQAVLFPIFSFNRGLFRVEGN